MGKRTESLQGPGWGGNPLARPPGGKAGTWQAFLHPTGSRRALGQMDRGTIQDVASSVIGIKVGA